MQSSPASDFGTPVQFRAICLRSQGIGCLSMLSKPKPMFPLQCSEVQSEQGGVRSEHFEFWACQLTPDLCVQMVLYSNGGWTLVTGCELEYNTIWGVPISPTTTPPNAGVGLCSPVRPWTLGLPCNFVQFALDPKGLVVYPCYPSQNLCFHCSAQKSNRSKGV